MLSEVQLSPCVGKSSHQQLPTISYCSFIHWREDLRPTLFQAAILNLQKESIGLVCNMTASTAAPLRGWGHSMARRDSPTKKGIATIDQNKWGLLFHLVFELYQSQPHQQNKNFPKYPSYFERQIIHSLDNSLVKSLPIIGF